MGRETEIERVNRQQVLERKAIMNSVVLPAAFIAFTQQ